MNLSIPYHKKFGKLSSLKSASPVRNVFQDDPQYTIIISRLEHAIESGVYPEMIRQGSSGSYLVCSIQGTKLGVFKPRDEEPYGPQNPKWMKWVQRKLCPLCFGRSCLLINQGYLSEAAASLVDVHLGLNVVPRTKVVWFASPTFSYTFVERTLADAVKRGGGNRSKSVASVRIRGLPAKIGSLQLFVDGYQSATEFDFNKVVSDPAKAVFQLEFEKLVILDYIIRNTDRGADNWLIKYEERPMWWKSRSTDSANAEFSIQESSVGNRLSAAPFAARSTDKAISCESGPLIPYVKIAAIDNGLAFPVKHPDEWRAYPYGWLNKPEATQPFSQSTIETFMCRLTPDSTEELIEKLRSLFMIDPDFKESQFKKQASVLRAQIMNLVKAFHENLSPAQLVDLPQFTSPENTGTCTTHKHSDHCWSAYRRLASTRKAMFNF